MYNPPPSKIKYVAALVSVLNVVGLLAVINESTPKAVQGVKVAIQWSTETYKTPQPTSAKPSPKVLYFQVVKKD